MFEEDTFDGLLSAIELCELINQDLFTEYSTHPTNDRVESSKPAEDKTFEDKDSGEMRS